ncbi:hypothetical protein [Nocardioides convexus]|uniref:hypothetical protein n=1 Tax=Nocardioides convexus TaxID=2712224 RepID=UPI002418B8B2|nr:hypothetical protein [Nocardioides convexus]
MTQDLDNDGLPRLPALTGPAVAESLPGLARVAGSAALHTAGWGVRTTTRNWLRVGKAVTNKDEAASLIRDVTSYVGALGEVARQVSGGVPVATALMRAGESLGGAERREPLAAPVVDGKVTASRPQSLRERGNDLLAKSRDVWSQDDRHPAFDRILDESRAGRGADPGDAAAQRPPAERGRAHRRPDRRGEQPA